MREAKIIRAVDGSALSSLPLEDFSRFKEKVIMINTLKSLLDQTDKRLLKEIAKREGNGMTSHNLKQAMKAIVEHAMKRV
jgi:hypothetical protein